MSEKEKPSKNAKNKEKGNEREEIGAKEDPMDCPPSSPSSQQNRKAISSGASTIKNIRQRTSNSSSPTTTNRSGSPCNNVQRSRESGHNNREQNHGQVRNHGSQRRRRYPSESDVMLEDDMEIEEGAVGGGVGDAPGALSAEMQCDNESPRVDPMPKLAAALANPDDIAANNQAVAYNWQANKTTVRERLGYIFNSETMADVHFLVGRGNQIQRIPAHKFVLSVGSAVFDAMFNGGMATTSNEVELPDIEPAAFLALLKFLYTDQVNIGPETVMTTLYTAKKYAVPALEKACVDFLKKNLSSDNALMLLTQARLFDEPQLAALCLETIDKNTTEALAAEGFSDIDHDTLCVVLERDTLGIREYKLFKAMCRWGEAECVRRNLPTTSDNQRSVLDRALHLVRFPIMTVEEFAGGPAQSGILSDREVVQLFLYFTVNPKPRVGFNDLPRCCLTGKEQVMSRFQQIESRWGYSGTSDRIRFVVNRKIFVVGFGLYGSIHGSAEYSVNIQIIQTDYGKVCGVNDTTFQCDGSTSTFRVMFKEPVEIQPNQNYTACATLKGPDSYYGTKGLRKVTHESMNSGKVTFMFTYAAGNNNGTSVEDGQIPEIIFYT